MAAWGAMALLAAVMALAAGAMAWSRRRRGAETKPVHELDPAPAPRTATEKAVDGIHGDWYLALVELAAVARSDGTDREGAAPTEAVAATARALSHFDSDPQRLPRRPQLLPQLLGTLNDDEAGGREIAMVIARDPVLAANLLKLANSSVYRVQSEPVESLDRAVALIGSQGLRQLVAVALMQPVMRASGSALGRLPDLVWEHTQHASVAAARFARTVEREDAFAAQLLALLQGLGMIVVLQALAGECARLSAPPPDADATAGLLRRWSVRIARRVAEEWQLSARMLQALDEQAGTDLARMGGLGRALAVSGPAALESLRQAQAPRGD